ncbi:MAG: hypothetical protein L0Z70_06700 [Chloroflexi bacterium]|nr:hypothetical protein [Chloroflexota bacterium]
MQKEQVRLALLLACLAALMIAGIAYATNITVDGNAADWPALAALSVETTGAPPAEAAISAVYFTNNTTHLFWRFNTAAATDWTQIGYMAICMDSEAAANVAFGPCTSDYTLQLDPTNGTAILWDNSSGNQISATIAIASEGSVTEISMLLSNVSITPANCAAGCTINASIAMDAFNFDEGAGVETSLVQNLGGGDIPAAVGQGSPTALTLVSFDARVEGLQRGTNWIGLWLALALALALAFLWVWKRSFPQAD